jgi:aerobic-type carbon monoxide dehydrogenase small subunit (CoxS/CutS family)
MKERDITLYVNGTQHDLRVPVNKTLLQVLREDLALTETKYGCGVGECGACTVLIDGKDAILACLSLAAVMNGKHITTAAGLEKDGKLHPIQKAFIDEGAIQCGYCTPGMIMKTVSLLKQNPHPSEKEIKSELEGNLCRCTGYVKIVKAVQRAGATVSRTRK